jgi:hypothetical protein
VIAAPPLSSGAEKLTVAALLEGVTEEIVGAPAAEAATKL